jgi:uncharacterized repeat protein (TIGR03803 family)
MSKLNWWKTIFFLCLCCGAEAIGSPAQSFRSLASFNGTNGEYPGDGSLVQGFDGNFYGTTFNGGANGPCFANGCGTAFKITPAGTLTTIYNFCSETGCTDGQSPYAGLVLSPNGNFYGTTMSGGNTACNGGDGCGTVFQITAAGALSTLHSFDGTDGNDPSSALIQAANGNFYGTTSAGGTNPDGSGTVFNITAGGSLTSLYDFCVQTNCADGQQPVAPLVQATNGNFYGTTSIGGASGDCPYSWGCGTIFEITVAGKLTTLYSFCSQANCSDGESPSYGPLLQARNGDFYGTTSEGGAFGYGTVFKITPTGTLTILHSFDGSDGLAPLAGLIQATDGNFYGTTLYNGGSSGNGTVVKITPQGTLTTLHSFDGTDGSQPIGGLVQATNGDFYGTTDIGGTSDNCSATPGCGTVYSLSVGLGPFVKSLPISGKVGAVVDILGTDLKGATGVTFNGTSAVFKVISPFLIGSTIPSGATTGTIQVVTPGGTLSSNVPFKVNQ